MLTSVNKKDIGPAAGTLPWCTMEKIVRKGVRQELEWNESETSAPLSESAYVCSFYHQPLWTTICVDNLYVAWGPVHKDAEKKSLRDGYELMFVAFIKRSVSSNGVHSFHCIFAWLAPCILFAVHTYGVLMCGDFPEALLQCKAKSRNISATDQVLQPDMIDGPGAQDDYWFKTVETHRFQIAGQTGCQGFVGGSVRGLKQATIVVVWPTAPQCWHGLRIWCANY